MKIQKMHYACAALLAASVPTIALAGGTEAKILNPTLRCNYPGDVHTTTGTPEYTAKIKNTSTTAATYTATLITVHEGKCLKRGPAPKQCGAELGGCFGKCEKRDADTENTHTATSDSIDAGKSWNLVIPLHASPEDSATFKSATLTVKAAGVTGGVVSTSPRSTALCQQQPH